MKPSKRVAGLRTLWARLSEYVERTKAEPVVITKHGKPLAVMYSAHGMDLEEVLLRTSCR